MPTASSPRSLALEDEETALASSAAGSGRRQSGSATFELKPASQDAEARRLSAGQSRSGRTSLTLNESPQNSNASPLTEAAANSIAIPTPAAITETQDAIWYLRPPTGGQYGPADGTTLFTWLQDQRVTPDSLVWRDGWPQWQIAGEAFEDFFGSGWRLPQADSDQTIPIAPASPTVAPRRASRKKKPSTYTSLIAVLAILAIALAVVLASLLLKP